MVKLKDGQANKQQEIYVMEKGVFDSEYQVKRLDGQYDMDKIIDRYIVLENISDDNYTVYVEDDEQGGMEYPYMVITNDGEALFVQDSEGLIVALEVILPTLSDDEFEEEEGVYFPKKGAAKKKTKKNKSAAKQKKIVSDDEDENDDMDEDDEDEDDQQQQARIKVKKKPARKKFNKYSM